MEQATCMPRLEGGSFSTHLVTPGWGAPQRGRSWDDGNLQLGIAGFRDCMGSVWYCEH